MKITSSPLVSILTDPAIWSVLERELTAIGFNFFISLLKTYLSEPTFGRQGLGYYLLPTAVKWLRVVTGGFEPVPAIAIGYASDLEALKSSFLRMSYALL